MNHGTHGLHGKRTVRKSFVERSSSACHIAERQTFVPQRDVRKTLGFLSFSVCSVCSVVHFSALGNVIPALYGSAGSVVSLRSTTG